jgi:hypothetical protein
LRPEFSGDNTDQDIADWHGVPRMMPDGGTEDDLEQTLALTALPGDLETTPARPIVGQSFRQGRLMFDDCETTANEATLEKVNFNFESARMVLPNELRPGVLVTKPHSARLMFVATVDTENGFAYCQELGKKGPFGNAVPYKISELSVPLGRTSG